jgi:ketosteroid isomerase-like protein
MRTAIWALAVALAAAPALASEKAGVMAAVKQFDNSFNIGDAKSLAATCSAQAIIIDDFPPHVWQGATTCHDWLNDLNAFGKKNGITDTIVTLHKPLHVDVSGDRAYVVVPTKYTYKMNGKRVVESGSIWTLALQKNRRRLAHCRLGLGAALEPRGRQLTLRQAQGEDSLQSSC